MSMFSLPVHFFLQAGLILSPIHWILGHLALILAAVLLHFASGGEEDICSDFANAKPEAVTWDGHDPIFAQDFIRTHMDVLANLFDPQQDPLPLWGRKCGPAGAGSQVSNCFNMLANAIAVWMIESTNYTLEDMPKAGVESNPRADPTLMSKFLHMAYFLRSEKCFDIPDRWQYDSLALVQPLAFGTPIFSSEQVEEVLSIFKMQAKSPRVTLRHEVQVVQIGKHASYLLELRTLWERHASEPLTFNFTDISLDMGRCRAAGCAVQPTQHPAFLRLLERMDNLGYDAGKMLLGLPEMVDELAAGVSQLNPDLVVCTHPPYICRILYDLAMEGIAVVGFFGGNIDSMVIFDEQVQWLTDFHAMAQRPNVQFTAISALLAVKIWSVTGVALPAIGAFGLTTQMAYAPRRPQVLIWKGSSECCENLAELTEALLNEFGEEGPSFITLGDLRAQGKSDYSTIASFRAVLLFIYDITLFSFFDLYHAAMPMFVPTRLLAPRYLFRGAVSYPRTNYLQRPGWPQEWWMLAPLLGLGADALGENGMEFHPYATTNLVRARFFWSQFVECYRWPAVQQFESLPDLVVRFREASLPAISAEMRLYSTTRLEEAGRFWRATLPRILSFRLSSS